MRFLVLVLLIIMGAASAASNAVAGDAPYTVSGIKVDATAQSAVVAQTLAINSGRAKAWQTLYKRLTKQQDWPRQPTLDDATLQRMISSYQVRDQRSSTTRFVGNVTYVFNPNAVRRILQQTDVAYSDVTARPILIIPLGPGWSAQTPWTQAWKDPRFSRAAVPLVLPQASGTGALALASIRFDSSTWQDVEPLVSGVRATEACLVLVIPERAQMIVKIRQLSASGGPGIPDLQIPVAPKTPAAKAFGEVADAAATAITESWKARSAADFGKRSNLLAAIKIDNLQDWVQALQKLGAVSTVTEVNVVAMDIGEARLAISYVGGPDQLSEQLAREGLSLSNEDGQWRLSRSISGVRP